MKRVEKQYADGVGSKTIVAIFQDKGERFSAATLRKYVQLDLLPKSKRIGQRGRHRGSSGRYPVEVIRLINDIKGALGEGLTLEEIRMSRVGLSSEVESLQRLTEQVISRFEEAIVQRSERSKRSVLKQGLAKHKRMLMRGTRELSRFATKMDQVATQ